MMLSNEVNEVKEVYAKITNFTNSTSAHRKLEGLAEYYLDEEHPYLQSEFIIGFILPLIEKSAKRYDEKRKVDGRNEYAFRRCKEIVEACPEIFGR